MMAMAESPEAARPVDELQLLRAVLAAAGTGTWWWDAPSGRVQWDPTLEALHGLEPGAFGGTYEDWLATLHPDERDNIVATVQESLDRRTGYQFEHRAVWPDGIVRWLECRGEVLVDLAGDAVGTVGCAIDITSRKADEVAQGALLADVQDAAARLLRLQRISRQLAGALTVDDVVSGVLDELDVPADVTARALWLVEPATGALLLAGQRGMVPAAVAMFQRIDREADIPGAVALREGRTVVSPSEADSLDRFPRLRGVPRSAPGFVAVPLVVEAEAIGVLAFGYDGHLDDSDVTFLEAAAGNIAQTLKRVRLSDVLELRSEELSLLAAITRAAVAAEDHRDLMQHIAAAVVPRLGEVCAIHFVPEPGAPAETVVAHADPRWAAWARALARRLLIPAVVDPSAVDDDGGPDEDVVARVLRTGRTEVEVHEVIPSTSGEPMPAGTITVPIYADARVVGALQVVTLDPAPTRADRRLALAHAVVDGVGEALNSRWVTDQHRHISVSLQRAFLPPTLRQIPGLDVAAAYWPAGVASEVGGDFYDVFPIGEREWAVLIGDACGTGPDAAATAAIARHTARAAARHGVDHVEVLEWVNQAVKHSDRNLFCTACYATVRTHDDGSVTIALASAGHPLPILIRDDGGTGAETLGVPGTLLGVFDDPRFHVREATLGAGDTLVLYTDGVTDLPPPAGRTAEELLDLVGGLARTEAAAVIAHLRNDLDRRTSIHHRADDAALLVLRNAADG